MILQCLNKRCQYKWEYKGKSPFYATCPRCLQKVRIKTKEELNAEPISKGSADALNKSSESEILKPAIDSTQSKKKAENGAGNGSDNDSNNGLKSDLEGSKND